MADDVRIKALTDHYIQLEILAKLAKSEGPVRFTDLKDPAIENSLFMYHANKLLKRELLEKSDSGFALTSKGADWLNFVGEGSLLPQRSPRLLVQLLIINSDDEVLLSRRTGSMKRLLNEYTLPGGLYKYGETLEQNLARVAEHYDCVADDFNLATIAETIASVDHGLYHSIAYVFEARANVDIRLPLNDSYEYAHRSTADVAKGGGLFVHPGFLQEFMQRHEAGLQDHELFQIA